MKLNKVLASAAFLSMFMCQQIAKAADGTEVEPVSVSEESECKPSFDGFMFGLGLGLNNAKYKLKLNKFSGGNDIKRSKNANIFTGVFWLGYGKSFGNFYLGLIANGDFGKSKDILWSYTPGDLLKLLGLNKGNSGNTAFDEILNDVSKDTDDRVCLKIKAEGFSPSLAVRMGYVPSSSSGLLAYVDFGASYRHVKAKLSAEHLENGKVKNSVDFSKWLHIHGINPVIRLGLQKTVCSNAAIDLNIEYRPKAKSSNKTARVEDNGGFAVRLSGIYNCK